MNDRVSFDTFTMERVLRAPTARVFEALSKPELKQRWFAGPSESWVQKERTMDFRVGGREHVSGVHGGKVTSVFDALYMDIVENERVVSVYEMTVNDRKISTTLATFQLVSEGDRTRLVYTEQTVFFDDPSSLAYAPRGQAESRREGTEGLLDRFVKVFES